MNERILDERTGIIVESVITRGELLLHRMSRQMRSPTCRYPFFACHQEGTTVVVVAVILSISGCQHRRGGAPRSGGNCEAYAHA